MSALPARIYDLIDAHAKRLLGLAELANPSDKLDRRRWRDERTAPSRHRRNSLGKNSARNLDRQARRPAHEWLNPKSGS